MTESIRFGVLRNMDEQKQGLPRESPEAVERHVRRGQALHELFDNDPSVAVRDWGATDDKQSHEHVTLLLELLDPDTINHVVLPGLAWLGAELRNAAVKAGATELVKYAFGKIWPKMKAGVVEMADVTIEAKQPISISINAAEKGGTIMITIGSDMKHFHGVEGGAT